MGNKIICGDALIELKKMPNDSIDCCVTSPPYWGLRDYGIEGQLGREKTPEEYVAKMVEVFREVKRVLKKEGVLFLNLGDSYSSGHTTGTKDSDTGWKHGELSKGYMGRSGGVADLSDCLKRSFEKGIFFFGSTDPRRSSTESINILIYDERSPDLIFKPFFTSQRVFVKNGEYDFCQVGSPLNPPVHCFIGSSLDWTFPKSSYSQYSMNISQDIGIIIATGDLNSDSPLCKVIASAIKNSKTTLSVKIAREPIPESNINAIPCFDTFTLYSVTKSGTQVNTIDNSITLLDSSDLNASFFGDFGIREASEEKLSLTLHNGTDLCFFGVRHKLFINDNGLTPYYSILDKAIKRKNYFQTKQEIGIPFFVRQALMEDGWICRQTIIWHKLNPMPESVKDRCTKAHEYIFLLAKSQKYYFDKNAISEPAKQCSIDRLQRAVSNKNKWLNGPDGQTKHTMNQPRENYKHLKGKAPERFGGADHLVAPWKDNVNKRSVWTITTKPFKGAHFATFPEDLILPCVLAGCPKGGTILDPFSGAGTTGVVAKKNFREFIGIELNPKYVEISKKRIANTQESLKWRKND